MWTVRKHYLIAFEFRPNPVNGTQRPMEMEYFSKISLDTVQDWHQVKAKFNEAALSHLEEAMKQRGKGDNAALRLHMEQVRILHPIQRNIESNASESF